MINAMARVNFMKWKKFKIKTKTEAEDIIISTLYDIGLEGAQIEDNVPLTALEKEQMFVDILPQMGEDDGTAYLSFFVEETETGKLLVNGDEVTEEQVLAMVNQELEGLRDFLDIGEGSIAVDETEDIDWINNWKQYFKQFYVDDILIIPSWETVKEETKDTVLLDVGTGSGILSIVALKLGAAHAVGTDLDPCAVPAVEENKEANQIPDKDFEMMIGNIIDDKEIQDAVGYEKYDIVTANILADVLVPLTPVIVHQMKKGGIYITSGILDVKESVVTEAVEKAGLEVLEVTRQGEWVSVTARKN